MNAPSNTTTTHIIQSRAWGGYTWRDVGDEYGATNADTEQLRAELAKQRASHGHESQFRALRIKRKVLDW